MKTSKIAIVSGLTAAALTGLCAYGMANASERKDMTTRTEESSVTTNDNGIVSRSYTECTVTTNGNMVTERRRETRTNMDADGNVLETSTSEFAQSYSVGDDGVAALTSPQVTDGEEETESKDADSFLGLAFGEAFGAEDTEFEKDPEGPVYLRATFTPEKPLDGFDDYFVYVTPKTHRVVKIYACAKDAVEPGPNWRRHYLIEAMERRYGTWARPCSYRRPCYAFGIGRDRFATVCLAAASPDYETVIAAWDRGMEGEAGREFEELRDEARKNAAEKRNQRVEAAAAAF